ncbi:MAG: leucine-rich repeat domain-containing protein, partial [Thermoguttaceae bacterium]|nr:leucine-rich repeat domain-containing protein [Thermoguttaceae bacterium]
MKKTSFILALLLLGAFLTSYSQAAETAQATPASSFKIDGKTLRKFKGSETEVVVPEGVTKIDEGAFSRCDSLKSVVIPEGVKIIGNEAFFVCDSLTSVAIPDSVKKIGNRAFSGCPALKEWIISPTHPHFKTDGTGLLTKDGKKLLACLNSAKEYRIPDGVTKIAYGAFYGCESLTSVVIPEGVTKIGDMMFDECHYFKSVVFPLGVKVFGVDAFCWCFSFSS